MRMLIIEDNSVYEIDEECLRHRRVPKECRTLEKLYGGSKENQNEESKTKQANGKGTRN